MKRCPESISRDNQILLLAAVAAFASGLLFQHNEVYRLTLSGWLLVAVCAAALMIYVCITGPGRKKPLLSGGIMIAAAPALMQLVSRFWDQGGESFASDTTIVLAVVLAVWCGLCVWMNGGITENTVSLMIWGGFLIRLFYVVMTQADVMQNDIGSFDRSLDGHLGYIRYLFDNWSLPDINPMSYYQMYHPPLHHFIGAVCMTVYSKLGLETAECVEALQMLPLFYTTAILVYLDKLAVRLKCSVQARFVIAGFAAFLPYSIYLGGAVNNDALVTLLMVMSLYYTVCWYQNGGWRNIVLMAVCVGCAVMTKTSGVLVAPAMALVMLWKLIKNRGQRLHFIRQYAVFGVIALPLGLWYHIRCLVKYNMPLGFVPSVAGTNQYVGQYTIWERFSDYRYALEQLYVRYDYRDGVNDYNIPITLVKGAVFGESNYYLKNDTVKTVGTVMFWMTLVLFILLCVGFLFWLSMKEYQKMDKAFFGTALAVILISYVCFCIRYPHVCTMNIRYVMTAVYLGIFIMGMVISGLQKRMAARKPACEKIFVWGVVIAVHVYVIASVLLIYNFELLQSV